MPQEHLNKSQKGFVTLMSVIIAGSIGLVLAGLLYMTSIWSIKNSGDDNFSAQSRKDLDACIEIALQTIHDTISFAGSGNLSLGGGNCTYLVTNTGGSTRTINATGTASSIYRKASISITAVSPKINIFSWQEVP
jgi:hypothetical protein